MITKADGIWTAHARLSAWDESGDRYGEVTKVGRRLVHVKMDRSGKVHGCAPQNLGKVY